MAQHPLRVGFRGSGFIPARETKKRKFLAPALAAAAASSYLQGSARPPPSGYAKGRRRARGNSQPRTVRKMAAARKKKLRMKNRGINCRGMCPVNGSPVSVTGLIIAEGEGNIMKKILALVV